MFSAVQPIRSVGFSRPPVTVPAAEGSKGTLKQEEIWKIVDYVHALPFEPASKPQKKLIVNTQAVSTGE